MEPCLCGDPACGRCFPGGQTYVECPDCGWKGQIYETLSDDGGQIEECPDCNSPRLVNFEPVDEPWPGSGTTAPE